MFNNNISYDMHNGKLFTVELWVEKSNKIILLGLTCNFILDSHFVKWKYLKITGTSIGKVFTTGRISD